MTQVIEDALRATVARSRGGVERDVTIVTFRGDGLQPGIDLADTSRGSRG